MSITGTSWFLSRLSAERYYRTYGCDAQDVADKISRGEIHIGNPPIRQGQSLTMLDRATRWGIKDGE